LAFALALLVVSGSLNSAVGQLQDNGDGTVTDQNTGLMWLQESPEHQDPTNLKTWPQAMFWANGLSFAGHDDWRLPSALEFSSGIPDLALNSTENEWGYFFGETLGNPSNASEIAPLVGYRCQWYWTSTEHPANSIQAVVFFHPFDNRYLNNFHAKYLERCVTAVRGDRVAVKASECSDTYDNDANGLVDFPEDGGCSTADDDWEYTCRGLLGCLFYRKVFILQCFEIGDSVVCIKVVFIFAILFLAGGAGYLLFRRRRRKEPTT
jgi:hypothetical protein